jgi:hypothetical protein
VLGSGLPATRPEAMADVPGVCEVPLTRAVVQYRESQDRTGTPAGARDLGLAVVLDGRSPFRVSALDLGSGQPRVLDLSTELVVLDWVYAPTLRHLEVLAEGARGTVVADRSGLETYCGEIARAVMERSGFGPLTRATLLRVAFRDLSQDLDPHEAAAIRVLLGPGRVARFHLDGDHVRLVVRTGGSRRDEPLEEALSEAFPTFELRRTPPTGPEGSVSYLVLLPVPASLGELRGTMERVRRGVGRVLARFEGERFRSLEGHLTTFGIRDSLERLRIRDVRGGSEPLGRGAAASEVVH